MPVVYADVVWLVNFAMDAVILLCTGWIVKRKLRALRILSGAFIGSLYSLVLFIPSLSFLTSWPMKAIVSLGMVAIAIPWVKWLDLLRCSVMYYFVAFVFAGATIALHFAVPGVSIAKGTVISGRGLMFVTSFKTLTLMMAIPTAMATVRYAIGKARQIQAKRAALCEVHLRVQGQAATFIGLVDTGNQLRDPISRKPVCFVEGGVVEHLFPEPIRKAIQDQKSLIDALSDVSDESWRKRFSLIPFQSAGGMAQMTIAFRPDEVHIVLQGVLQPARSQCLFAIQTRALSTDGRFQAILHTELISGDESNESYNVSRQAQSQTADSTSTLVDSGSSETLRRL
jgi:stage II sporulation protein GA (sporulation sigma-E factor processing peptidase)